MSLFLDERDASQREMQHIQLTRFSFYCYNHIDRATEPGPGLEDNSYCSLEGLIDSILGTNDHLWNDQTTVP